MISLNANTPAETVAPGVTRKILSWGGRMMAAELEFEAGAVGAPHSHPHEQVGYVVSGSFLLELDGQTYTVCAGDTYYCPPDARHGVVAQEKSRLVDVFTPIREDFLK